MVSIAKYYQRAKNGVHALQALIIFIGAVITIAIFVKSGQGDGRINYYFVLVCSYDTNIKLVSDAFLTRRSAGFVYLLSSIKPGFQFSSEPSASQMPTPMQSLIFFSQFSGSRPSSECTCGSVRVLMRRKAGTKKTNYVRSSLGDLQASVS